jgi:hypothetical protein
MTKLLLHEDMSLFEETKGLVTEAKKWFVSWSLLFMRGHDLFAASTDADLTTNIKV